MIITIDGPSASGKSTLAQLLAIKLKYFYINSGLLFRGLSYLVLEKTNNNINALKEITFEDVENIISNQELIYVYQNNNAKILSNLLNNLIDITPFLKDSKIDNASSIIATNPEVRKALVDYQRIIAKNRNIVADGRDCGTAVFPKADLKIYLTASPEIRAKRWQEDQLARGKGFSFDESLETINKRDNRDSNRKDDPLQVASDAIVIDNSIITINQTIEYILDLLKAKN